jgi:glycosyltransferase involved in cell wall biosynthesis
MLSVIATIYNKDYESITTFLEGFKRQTSSDFEIVLVDDCSDWDYQEIVNSYLEHMRITYIRFGTNRGQCVSRNTAIEMSEGDVVCIVDSDCVPNPGFVEGHLREHRNHPWLDVVIGPYNIESNGRAIWKIIAEYEADKGLLDRDMQLQLPSNPGYFLNFITRNVSVKREAMPMPLFDVNFGYEGKNPQSGFGWEDVEAGFRLFRAGLGMGFTYSAFTVHLSHPSTTDARIKPMRSLRNFSKLLLKHPLMTNTAARKWIVETYGRIFQWFQNTKPHEVFSDKNNPWGAIVINLTRKHELAHPMVVESVLSKWVPGIEIYVVPEQGYVSSIAQYHAALHSYVHYRTQAPKHLAKTRQVYYEMDDCSLLDVMPRTRREARAMTKGKSPTIGGDQESNAYFKCDLVPILQGNPKRVNRRLKILTYRWHVGHQYELWKLPHDFYIVEDHTTMAWDYNVRPLPPNAHFVPLDQVDPAEYDFAILHFDENCVNPRISNGVLHDGWGAIFRRMMEVTKDLPRAAICHGTPPFIGMFNVEYRGKNLMRTWTSELKKIREYVGDMPIVCNSHAAWEQWGFPNSKVIWHGFDSNEYSLEDPGHGILYAANSIRHRPWYRGYNEFKDLSRRFECNYLGRDDLGEFNRITVPEPESAPDPNEYARRKFKLYQGTLAQHAIFLNTTLRSPMPRSRAEAMLKGLVCVTMDFHDESMFITNGVNGFTGTSVEELEEGLTWLERNPGKVRSIGLRGRETIRRIFPHTRYLEEWHQTIYDILGE